MAVLFTSALSGTKANLVGEYTINYQDVANNRTNVTATLSIVSTGYYLSGTSTIFFNGTRYNPYINISQWGRQVVATQTYNINHNSDGTGSISISGSCNVANGSFQASGSGGAGLPTIPRASQPSLVTFPNSTDNIFIGDRVTIHFNRKSTSFTHKIQLLFDGYNPYLVENPIGGDNWVWDTSINATKIYKKMPTVNRKQGTIRLYTYNGGTLIGSKDVNFIANIKDANPIFTNFEYEIIDDKSISLTGNNKTAIKSFSNVKAIVSSINKAQAQKEATITKYKFVCGNKQIEVPYNDDTEMLLEQIDNITMNVYAIDSRGNSTMVGKTFDNFIEYENIKITELNANRLNGVDTQTNLSYKGNYWGKSFGEVSNTIKSVKYEYKEIDGTEWVLGETDITPKIGTVNKTASGTEITVEDSLAFPLNSIKIDGKTVQDGTPTPDNPVEIKNVKGYSNLFNVPYNTKTGNGMTLTYQDKKIFFNGTTTALTNFWSNDFSILLPKGTYTLSSNVNLQGKGAYALKDGVGNIVQSNLSTPATFTITEDKVASLFLIQINQGVTFNNQEFQIQLVEGNKEKPFIPFGNNCLKINSNGKNLFNYKDTKKVDEGIKVDEEGWITVTYDNSQSSSAKYFNYITNNLDLTEKTKYQIVTEVKKVDGELILYSVSNNQGQMKNNISYEFNGLQTNLIYRDINETYDNFNNSFYALRTYVRFAQGKKGSITFRLSVLKDISTTNEFAYTPYNTNSIFLNLKDNELAENDFVKIANNYGTIYKTSKKIIIDENSGMTYDAASSTSEYNRFTGHVLNGHKDNSLYDTVCTHYKSGSDTINCQRAGSGNFKELLIIWTDKSMTSTEQFNEFLKTQKENGTPVTVQYNLATPYTVDLGIQDNLDTYEGTTVISLEDELNPNMEINYVAKGEEGIGLGKFDFSGLIKGDLEALGFTLNKSFNIKVTISDELSTFSLETILNTGTPNLAIAKSGVSIGSKYDESVGGKVQGIYEIGDLFISTKNENPSIRFGGTWEQIKDVFLLACGDKYKAGAKGGSEKHTLTKAEIPHLGSGIKYGGNAIAGGNGWSDDWLGGADTPQSFSIMPPYLAVYVWVRTA